MTAEQQVEIEVTCAVCGKAVEPKAAIAVREQIVHDTHTVKQIEQKTGVRLGTAKPKAAKASTPREPIEKVAPTAFAELVTRLGLSKKEVAAAIGKSLSRVSELTVSQGAGKPTYDAFVVAVEKYAAEHPRPVEQPTTDA